MNHPGVIDYKSKTYLFYHNGALPGGGGFDRSVCVDELNFDANGGVSRVTPTPGLSQGVGTLNPFDHIQAETIAWEQGVHLQSFVPVMPLFYIFSKLNTFSSFPSTSNQRPAHPPVTFSVFILPIKVDFFP